MCKRNLKILNVCIDKWEELANDGDKWRSSIYKSLKEGEKQFFAEVPNNLISIVIQCYRKSKIMD